MCSRLKKSQEMPVHELWLLPLRDMTGAWNGNEPRSGHRRMQIRSDSDGKDAILLAPQNECVLREGGQSGSEAAFPHGQMPAGAHHRSEESGPFPVPVRAIQDRRRQ